MPIRAIGASNTPASRRPKRWNQLAEWINASTDEVGIDGLLQQHGKPAYPAARCSVTWRCWWSKTHGVRGEASHPLPPPATARRICADIHRCGNSSAPSTADYVPTSKRAQTSVPLSPSPATCVNRWATNWTFCRATRPNHTAYLPPGLREQLHSLGRSPADQTPGHLCQRHLQRLLIDLSWASSSHLEGNNTATSTPERLIEFGQAAEGKNARNPDDPEPQAGHRIPGAQPRKRPRTHRR